MKRVLKIEKSPFAAKNSKPGPIKTFAEKQKQKIDWQWPGSWFDQPSNEEKTHNQTQPYYFPIAIAC